MAKKTIGQIVTRPGRTVNRSDLSPFLFLRI